MFYNKHDVKSATKSTKLCFWEYLVKISELRLDFYTRDKLKSWLPYESPVWSRWEDGLDYVREVQRFKLGLVSFYSGEQRPNELLISDSKARDSSFAPVCLQISV